MNKKAIITIATILALFTNLSAQNSFPKQLVGYWVNAELMNNQNEKIKALISPQFLCFDTLGKCTFQTRAEHKLALGKPTSSRKFDSVYQFTYIINKSRVVINQIEGDDDLLYISFSDVPVSIVFKRYKMNQ